MPNSEITHLSPDKSAIAEVGDRSGGVVYAKCAWGPKRGLFCSPSLACASPFFATDQGRECQNAPKSREFFGGLSFPNTLIRCVQRLHKGSPLRVQEYFFKVQKKTFFFGCYQVQALCCEVFAQSRHPQGSISGPGFRQKEMLEGE